jgi:hypothetical protein
LTDYSDSDWADNPDHRKSTIGYAFGTGSGIVSWSSKKQPIVSLSSTEAECKALCATTCEAVWLRRLLQDVGEEQNESTMIKCDNQSSIKLRIIRFIMQGQSMLMRSFILLEKSCSQMK